MTLTIGELRKYLNERIPELEADIDNAYTSEMREFAHGQWYQLNELQEKLEMS